MRRARPLIVGGGPAGAAAAIVLARAGTPALMIERHAEPQEIVCGGFLGWDALGALDRLGIDAGVLGARPIARVRVIAGATRFEAALPFAAAGLSRRTLDGALRAQALAVGTGNETAKVASADGDALRLTMTDGGTIDADALFLATGKHELRGVARPRAAAGADPAIGLRTRLGATPALSAALAGVIELHLFDHGYAGLLLQEDGAANLCLSVAQSRLAAAGGGIDALIAGIAAQAPGFAERIGQARAVAAWQTIAAVPYGWRTREATAGLFRLGDQAAVIASLAGDGVAIALASGQAAALAYGDGGAQGAVGYQRGFARRARRPLAVAGALRHLGERPGAGRFAAIAGGVPGMAQLLARLTRIG